MEKLTSNRYYFDFNATSPFAPSIKSWLAKGDFVFANPSSIHTDGKKSKRVITETSEYLFKLFNLSENNFNLVYHSGATEGINEIIKGFALNHHNKDTKISFAYFKSDHSCIREHEKFLNDRGHEVIALNVDQNGEFKLDTAIETLKKAKYPLLFNFTWVNNETGVVFNLEDALKIKNATNAYVHVDAVQSIGKIEEWKTLNSELDSYSYSAHKFGALKGIGFSFIRENFPYTPLLVGGGQQKGMRSGTENVLGIESIKIALEYIEENYNFKAQKEATEYLKAEIEKITNNKAELVCKDAKKTNGQTVYVVFYESRSDITSVAFDLGGIDISTGSACSSGSVKPSKVLLSLGYDEEKSKSAIRFSFSPYVTLKEMKEDYAPKILEIISRFTS